MTKGGDDTRKHRKPETIISRIVVPLFLVAILQGVLVVGMMAAYGVFTELRENALASLDERTQNKHQNMEMEMTVNWSYLAGTDEKAMDIITNTLSAEGKDYADIATDTALNETLLLAVVPELVSRVRSNNTTGVFLVLNGTGMTGDPNSYAGVYLRDSEPGVDEADNSDIRVFRGTHLIFQNTILLADEQWWPTFSFPGGADNTENAYFYRPLQAALSQSAVNAQAAGYWSEPYRIDGEGYGKVITYSEPLHDNRGNVIGVAGVEMSVDMLTDKLSKGEFARTGRGCYFLGVTEDGGLTYHKVATGGDKFAAFFGTDTNILTSVAPAENGRMMIKSPVNGETMHAAVMNLALYPEGSPFAGEQWALIGMVDETTLFTFVTTVRHIFIVGTVLAVLLGLAVAAFTGRRIVEPVIRLVNSLNESDPNEALRLERTNIEEIDQLAGAITKLNHDVIESATRLTKILKLAGLSVGVFEIRNDSDTAYCSDDVFSLLWREDLRSHNNLIPKAVCLAMVEEAMQEAVEATIFRLHSEGRERFVRIRRMQEPNGIVGAILDVTPEMENRRRIERERDYDLLTGILNRRAFEKSAVELFSGDRKEIGIAAMIMLDLDNLKFLNDTYGHDSGDGYICAFADSLLLFGSENALVARRSGDEFYVLLYGGKSKQSMRRKIRRAWENILTHTYILPDGTPYKIRASAGVAWYPGDADTLTQLIHFADYAMYKVKRSAKGTMVEFSARDYGEDSFLVSGRNALDRMIDGQLVRFMVQPILSAPTGETVGYELLMRTEVQELPDPESVLRLASAEGKLPHIERLTWFKGLETAKEMLDSGKVPQRTLFFLNSIANQALSRADERQVEEIYGSILGRLAVEVTESERNDKDCTEQKIRFVKNHGGKIAIDDYGTGYNSELALVKIDASIVKLDISFVRGVDTSADKQSLIRNLISYARQRGIAVLAEGVETNAEMRTLIRYGVDYLQGYYFGRPQYEPREIDKRMREEIRQIFSEHETSG